MSNVGLFGKYVLSKADGSDLDSCAKYFVVRYDAAAKHGPQGRTALRLYCQAVRFIMPELADQLESAIREEARIAFDRDEALEKAAQEAPHE